MKADHKQVTKYLNMAKGQLEGIIKMVEEDRYCIDISNQLLATTAIIKKANKAVLSAHLQSCVRESLNEEGAQKIDEIMTVLSKLS